jgi:hypothetical protein
LSARIPTQRISVETVIKFIAGQLVDFPLWQDVKPDHNENFYNQRLERLLQVRARKYCDAIQVGRETIYTTPGSHDISAFPADEEGLVIRGRSFGPEQPIYTIECKRLLSTTRAERRREYLTSEKGESPRGAVQRYKLGIHGAGLDEAGIVGYVQDESFVWWRTTVNTWLGELVANPVDSAVWNSSERLRPHPKFKKVKKILVSTSMSTRVSGRRIRLSHFFVDLRAGRQTEFKFP